MPHHGRAVAAALGLTGDLAKQAANVTAKLYDAFLGTDAAQIEINPLAVTEDGKLMVLDAKVGFDSNAGFRHKDLAELRDETEEDPQELEARSEEHTSELQSLMRISYAVFCLKKNKHRRPSTSSTNNETNSKYIL